MDTGCRWKPSDVPGYIMLKKLGDGGQASVFQAARISDIEDEPNGSERVAVKIFHGDNAQRSCQTELRHLVAVQGHCNIVRLVECFDFHPTLNALVLELCETDLEVLCSQSDISESEAIRITRGALSGLEHMHKHGIVHRDVKPENISMAYDGSARLIDFGVAACVSNAKEMSRRRGSFEYMAPELFNKELYGVAVDMFAFGATLYFVLGKRRPLAIQGMTYEAAAAQSRSYNISFGRKFRHVSKDSTSLILWLMHPCDTWRPDASFALTCPPYAPSLQDDHQHEVRSFETRLESRVVAEVHPTPPLQQREGPRRPTLLSAFEASTVS
eukprot:TRINITY_DN29463_c0_g1_i1.p1 TRINITY_DN29463_c0_g1~~TRINITY_DN29463_c0_g1_i1.p1  ORF type:complete len:328 (+),score=21.77 TRINITY_DN29463_c0_g1_i1:66-1049(+)